MGKELALLSQQALGRPTAALAQGATENLMAPQARPSHAA